MGKEIKIRALEDKIMAILAELEKKPNDKELLQQYRIYRKQYYSYTQTHFNPARFAEIRGLIIYHE